MYLVLSQIVGPCECAPESLRVAKQTRRIIQCHAATSELPPAFVARKRAITIGTCTFRVLDII